MLVRTQILIFGLIGNVIIAGILLYMNVQNQNIQTKSANSQYTSIVESAWVQSIDNSFSNLNSWGTSGEKGQQYWNPYSEIPLFIDIGFEGFDYANPLIEALDQEIESDLFIMIDEMFLDEVDLGYISFIKIYNENNKELTCLYAFDWADVGNSIDVCDANNKINFLATLPSMDELRGKILGLISAPAQKIASIVKEPAGKMARMMSAQSKKLEESN